jgi:dihydrofolate reductase
MRRICYVVAASLDGYIGGPKGEADWIIRDPDVDFRAIYARFDTVLLGRRTFEAASSAFQMPGMQPFVCSRTLRQRDHPQVTIIAEKSEEVLSAPRAESGKDIWLFGGGSLFRSLLNAGLVDTVEVAVISILLGGGIPLLLPPAKQAKLSGHKVYKSEIVALEYAVVKAPPSPALQRNGPAVAKGNGDP